MNIVQFAHGVLVEAEDVAHKLTAALPSFHPLPEDMPVNPAVAADTVNVQTPSGAPDTGATRENAAWTPPADITMGKELPIATPEATDVASNTPERIAAAQRIAEQEQATQQGLNKPDTSNELSATMASQGELGAGAATSDDEVAAAEKKRADEEAAAYQAKADQEAAQAAAEAEAKAKADAEAAQAQADADAAAAADKTSKKKGA